MPDKQGKNKALIIGAGTGGLLAAAALSPYFKTVQVVEKDSLPLSPAVRKGVGQAAHLHSLLLGGLQILERFLPGIADDLRQAGSKTLRAGLDQQIHEYGVWLPERDLGFEILAQSRYLLEHVIRNRVARLDNVVIDDHWRIEQLILSTGKTVVGAVGSGDSSDTQELLADLVVDCSGRAGKFVRQLSNFFPDMDRVDEIQSNIVYASAFVDKPQALVGQQENILIIAEPGASAGGALIDVEGNRWCVSLHGRNGVVPPTDPEAWKSFARSLPADRIYQRLTQAEYIHPVSVYKKPLSIWRRFDLMTDFPSGYFPLGDVITSVNPTFGQGMTLGFGHAVALNDAFAAGGSDELIQKHYLKAAADWSQKAWRVCAAYDSSFKGDELSRQKNFQILRSLSLKKQNEAIADPEAHKRLFRQAQMINH
ncbi:FAD-dependent oxidoreductase [Gynuella sp.]|uniref:FAD-dependent oxidoreductase n=1 Tax=Gynuella sp. TaxID=2969146 RepID=UPI003D0BF37E